MRPKPASFAPSGVTGSRLTVTCVSGAGVAHSAGSGVTAHSDHCAPITADRDNPGRYCIIVEFDSYEEAMRNSNDPETGRFAEQMGKLLDEPPVFHNLDVRTIMNVR